MNSIALGATLYVPVLRSNLLDIVSGSDPDLRSIVVCLEDSIRGDQVGEAQQRFTEFLSDISALATRITVFARPRDLPMLHWMLAQPAAEALDGFVLPKIETSNIALWLAAMVETKHYFMPTIEGAEAFDRHALDQLCMQLLPFKERVIAVRIGGNDILNILGARRSKSRTAYDGPLGNVIRDIAATFIPAGFAVSAPVFEHYASPDLLREEVEQDIEHGLLTKTAIHPAQVSVIHDCYRPTSAEIFEARSILDSDAQAVFGSQGSMCEPATHNRWAGYIIARAQHFGVDDAVSVASIRVA